MKPPFPTRHAGSNRPARIAVLLLLALLAHPVSAQTAAPAPSAYDRSIAAGYKALTLCGAIFNGGRSASEAEALELTGIYPEYDAILPSLEAKVERYRTVPREDQGAQVWAGSVTVPFDDKLPPRVAEWVFDRGCTIYPLGAPRESIGLNTLFGRTEAFGGSLDSQSWPMGDRGISARAPAPLQASVSRAFDGAFSGRTTGVVVLRDGHVIAERYADGFDAQTAQRTWSVAKSIAGTLVGIAVRDKLLDPAQPVFPERQDLRGTITLDQTLRMASGLHGGSAGSRTDALYFGGTTVDEETGYWLAEALPGTRFRYANNDIVLAVRQLRRALDDDARYENFPRTELFAKLGMTRTVAELDSGGNFVLSSQVWSTARDLARLGQFWLQDGMWNGQRILPEGWVRYMTSPSGPQPESGNGYGATLWLMGTGQGVPEGTFAAIGNRGQFIVVVPSRNLVIVRRGEDRAGAGFDIDKFAADVLASLP